jgi:predicted DNA-binding transcriptional regulator AlpA
MAAPASPERPLVSVNEAATLAGVSRSVAYRWARLGCLPGAVSIGGRWYVRSKVLMDWLEGAGVEKAAVPSAAELRGCRADSQRPA